MLQAEADFGYDLRLSWMVGDRTTDVEAGRRAGCRTVLLAGVDTPGPGLKQPDFFAADITEASNYIALHTAATPTL
jgi:D-glycero-D-manno-heptose 1,7-bisphosphate phosphatase